MTTKLRGRAAVTWNNFDSLFVERFKYRTNRIMLPAKNELKIICNKAW